jgi:hypothetical protein
MYRGGSVLAEKARRELVAQGEDQGLGRRVRPAGPVRGRRAVGPVDLVPERRVGPGERPLDGAEPNAEAGRDRALRGASPDGDDERLAAPLNLAVGPRAFSPSSPSRSLLAEP